jgi:hypothetical protein
VRFNHPGAVPVVELLAAPMMTKFGKKSKPLFKVVDWRNGGATGATIPVRPRIEPPKIASPKTVHPAFDAEIPAFDDDIPAFDDQTF